MTTTTTRPTEAICPTYCVGHDDRYQPWEARTDGSGQERDHASPVSSFGPVEIYFRQTERIYFRQTEDSRHVLGAPVIDIFVNDGASELTEAEAHELGLALVRAGDTIRRLRQEAGR